MTEKHWTKKCTCENFQQNEDCEHIGDKILEEVGLGTDDYNNPFTPNPCTAHVGRVREEVENEYIECECPNCQTKMRQPKWLLDKYEKEGDAVYCSEGCRYHAETGYSAEEY